MYQAVLPVTLLKLYMHLYGAVFPFKAGKGIIKCNLSNESSSLSSTFLLC